MSSRRKIRFDAVEIVFEAAQRKRKPVDVAQTREDVAGKPLASYTKKIVRGVQEHETDIDEVIATHARGWTLDRMPAMDLAILRVAVWEILYETKLDDPIAISEATKIAAEYSTDDSPSFVNGLLDRIAKVKDLYVS
ncbi:transcription antitermination factor NusB [Micrococcoides hystricis]|uniref:Transcription antitermination protein NusB n=1 Tax=Micrococcoides hystricis TaxID=1572761 RepID=A0ABV6P7H2_9MICC